MRADQAERKPIAETFREIVTGRRHGPLATLARAGLAVAEVPYRFVVRQRNRRYDQGRLAIHRIPVPVISVGNLTLGGTGKTPLVAWIAQWYRQQGVRVAIISRGYGAGAEAANDESRELESRLPDVPHVQHHDRVKAATIAVEELASQLILVDDGFQHRRLARDLDLVLIDATEPFGGNRVFPRGLLREPVQGLRRADAVVLTRSHLVTADQREQIRQRVQQDAPQANWIVVSHHPTSLRAASGHLEPLSKWERARVAAFCGIGNPEAFRQTLLRQGWDVAQFRAFPDHHAYTRADVDSISRDLASDTTVQAILCTHKDLVKLGTDRLGTVPLFAVLIDLTIDEGQAAFESQLRELQSRLGD